MALSSAARQGNYRRQSTSASGPPPFVDGNGAQSPNKVPPVAGSQLFGPAGMFAGEAANIGGLNTLPTPPHAFESEATSLEYSILSAMLNGIDPSLLSGSPDQDGTYGSSFTEGQDPAMTPGVSGGLDLKNFFETSGTNLPSVGMATDQSSHWLLDVQPQNGGVWASASSSSTPFASSSAAGYSNDPSKQQAESIGQLHAIGGNDPNAAAGEVGSGGFKALEVPSPSPSLGSVQRLGFEDGFANSNSPDVGGRTGGQLDGSASQQGLPTGQANNVAVVRGGATYNGPDLQMLEAQWRERVNQIYGSTAKPFPYTEGYHFLLKFVTEKFEKAEVLRIVRALGLFRPSLIALQMPLTEEDEIFVERSIQRTVLELEKLVSASADILPHCAS
ncbi:hypothetical protein BCV69DRAFT_281283 [Microstroma glucosiphilum]|uniref:Uncharacterized protein n=1 Tax=Pseudomicrostroma glucosiphilum TaxID=1684307 RepID=A0A316UAU5_9BASI|nr:hypothetical protein BCV69DRAFT_281283 [Pseudomicrostroma glucosiphilum]PWN22279.1 hypothetical protein BCV69DRAFT_281283 [Pseudomicrostroma glucosiphilum]